VCVSVKPNDIEREMLMRGVQADLHRASLIAIEAEQRGSRHLTLGVSNPQRRGGFPSWTQSR